MLFGIVYYPINARLATKLNGKQGAYFSHVRFGAGNEIRTRDLNLGKVALYQLSYSRA